MRRDGLWHAELVGLLVALRHTESIVIADAGLPVPNDVTTIELGWRRGEPPVLAVLDAVLAELVVERAEIAKEATDETFVHGVETLCGTVPIERISHEDLKAACGSARAVVRTGEATPYANVVLHAGVPFGAKAAR
jgi:D-ribose pyranase